MDRTDEVSNHIYGKVTLTWFEEIFRRVLVFSKSLIAFFQQLF
ncbi:TPA: lysyl-tRNA synthetase [Streptococcus pneumoniae]|nr:lysyl-tRNA synthetase [Streptococcus pneumoniae]HEW9426838.1 lysyl-tRNA synthetase [Streptococcus pneumoniae]